MKSEWKTEILEHVCQLITDGAHNSPKSVESGEYMASVKDFTDYGLDFSKCKLISENDYNLLKKQGCVPEINDILVGKDGARFFEDIIIYKQLERPALLSSIAILRPDQSIITPEFLYYTLRSPSVRQNVRENYGSGSAIPRIVLKDFKRMPISFPSIVEQRRITSILLVLDQKIQLNNEINKNLQSQAQVIYDHLILEKADKTWSEGLLSDIATITMGQSPKGSSYNENGVGAVFFQGRAEFGFRFPIRKLYTTDPKRMAQANDVLMSVRAPVGDINVAYEDCCIGRGLSSIRSKDNHQSYVLYTMFNLRKQIDIFNGEGTVFGAINRDALNSMPISFPPLKVIDHFEALVSPMDAAILNNYKESVRLQTIRDSMLPMLMSGEIDVSNIAL